MNERGRSLHTQFDTDGWPRAIDGSDRFKRLQRAIGLLEAGASYTTAAVVAKLSETRVRKIVARCLSRHEDGQLFGWRGCVKHSRIHSPIRTLSLDPSAKSAPGALSLYMQDHPDVAKALHAYAGRKGLYGRTPNLSQKRDAFAEFRQLVRRQPNAATSYPLTTKQEGRRPFYVWWKRHIAGTKAGIAAEVGDAAAERVHGSSVEAVMPVAAHDHDPMAAWEIDETDIRLDAVYRVPSLPPYTVETPLRMFQVLKCKDVGSGAILSQSFIFSRSVRVDDLMHLYFLALTGEPKRKLTIEGLAYAEGADYPSNVIPAVRGIPPKRIRLDNALAHLANAFRAAIEGHGAIVDLGRIATPEVRGSVEAEMAAQAIQFARYLPNLRNEEGRKARANKVFLDATAIEEAIDVFTRNRNARPARAAGYAAPLSRIREAVSLGRIDTAIRLSKAQLDPVHFSSGSWSRVIADFQKGRSPFVWFREVRYKSEWLTERVNLIGKRLLLKPRVDLRHVVAFLDGKELGALRAEGKWGLIPHDRRIRTMWMRLKRNGGLAMTGDEDPIRAIFRQLRANAKTDVRAENDLAYLVHYLESSIEDPDLAAIVQDYKTSIKALDAAAARAKPLDEVAIAPTVPLDRKGTPVLVFVKP